MKKYRKPQHRVLTIVLWPDAPIALDFALNRPCRMLRLLRQLKARHIRLEPKSLSDAEYRRRFIRPMPGMRRRLTKKERRTPVPF